MKRHTYEGVSNYEGEERKSSHTCALILSARIMFSQLPKASIKLATCLQPIGFKTQTKQSCSLYFPGRGNKKQPNPLHKAC